MKRTSSCLAATLLLLCGSASAQAEPEPVSVWILPFDVRGDVPGDEGAPDELGVVIADLLTASLSRSPGYAVVDRQGLADVLAERSETGGVSDQLVLARWMLHGTVTRRGESIAVTAHVTDVASTRILASARVQGASAGGASELSRLVRALTTELSELPRSVARRAGTGETDTAPVANLHFMRGLSRYHAGQDHLALAEFIRSGTEPELEELSSLWRANCYLSAKRYDHAFLELTRLRLRGSVRVKPADVQRLLDECLQHLSAEEVRICRELA